MRVARSCRNCLLSALVLFFPLVILAANAAEARPPDALVTLRGFATLGLLASDDDRLVFVREISQDGKQLSHDAWRRDSRLGLQVNVTPNAQWEFVLQGVWREKAGNTFANSIEWAFVRHSPAPDWDIRAGRLGLDIFLLSDHRSVGYTYAWVRPPVDYYGWFPLATLDGIDVAHRWNVGDGRLRAKAFLGRSTTRLPLWDEKVEFRMSPIGGASLLWEDGTWSLGGNLSHGRIGNDWLVPGQLIAAMDNVAPYWPGGAVLQREFAVRGSSMTYASVGAGYDDGRWQILGEFSVTKSRRLVLPRGTRAYVSLGRRFGEIMPFLLLSHSHERRHATVADPLTPQLYPLRDLALGAVNRQLMNQSSLAVGARWDIAPNMALKLQFDRSRIPYDALGTRLLKPGNVWQGGYQNSATLAMEVVF